MTGCEVRSHVSWPDRMSVGHTWTWHSRPSTEGPASLPPAYAQGHASRTGPLCSDHSGCFPGRPLAWSASPPVPVSPSRPTYSACPSIPSRKSESLCPVHPLAHHISLAGARLYRLTVLLSVSLPVTVTSSWAFILCSSSSKPRCPVVWSDT